MQLGVCIMEKLEGMISDIVFKNEENGYTIAYLANEDEEVTIVGCMPTLSVGESIEVEGKWVTHKTYGSQFEVTSFMPITPSSLEGIYAYLSSGMIHGIGEKMALRIIEKFGVDTLDVIQNTPERLKEVEGIGSKKIKQITESYEENRELRNIIMQLSPYGITPNYCLKIYKKYSDYIRYPIKMEVEHQRKQEGKEDKLETVKELETINSMIPLWKRPKKDIKQEEYNSFYIDKFHDYENPLKVIHTKVEGGCSYSAILYIPSHLPFDYYTSDYEKGLQLYSNGVLIMEKCEELLPDYFGFVKGLVDSEDLSLNISREILQQDRQLKTIAKNIESKIKSELQSMLANNREEYEKFFDIFGVQLKFGTYNDYGMNKELLQDLLLFHSSDEGKYVSLKEYIETAKEGQDSIYYACGETIDKIEMLPQVEKVKDKGYKILYLTDNVDEFVLQVVMEYEGKKFVNVCADNLNLDTEEEKEELKKINEENKDMFSFMKEALKDSVQDIRFTHRLKNHPVCLTSEGAISIEMEKVMKQMPNNQNIKAQTILEINADHEIAKKLKELYKNDKEELKKYTKIIYAGARLIEGLAIDNPTEISNLTCEILAK